MMLAFQNLLAIGTTDFDSVDAPHSWSAWTAQFRSAGIDHVTHVISAIYAAFSLALTIEAINEERS
jgi:hypothetical protein